MSNADPRAIYRTELGTAYVGDSRILLDRLEAKSIDLVITSPPFALQRKKEYGNKDQDEYVDWLCQFAPGVFRVLKDSGSFVLDLGGAYKKGRPVRSLYNYRVLLRFCDEFTLELAEEFFWFNPAKLPSPIEWVNKRKIRTKDAVNTVWWFSKTDEPKADVRKVLVPYSERMKTLLKNPDAFYRPKKRPSGHDISAGFANGNGGAIPSNLLQIPNTESNSKYLRLCKAFEVKRHPARFPLKLPLFFVNFLTDPGDTVLDIFAGSNTTGEAAESTDRRWISCDLDKSYVTSSVFRFFTDPPTESQKELYSRMHQSRPEVVQIPSGEKQLLLQYGTPDG